MKEAYVNWNAGICRVIEYPSQRLVCRSKDFKRATNAARGKGFHVRVYSGEGSYVLKARKA